MPKPILPDLLKPHLKVVFCGRAVGLESACQGYYYANAMNKFWPILHEVGFTPTLLQPHEYPKLLDEGLGLTDSVKYITGSDKHIPVSDKDISILKKKISRYQPKILAFNGKTPAKGFLNCKKVSYGKQEQKVGHTKIWVLPSTSPVAGKYWNPDHWKKLKKIADKL
jgi:TDG/mug DNA glycosylase family protein